MAWRWFTLALLLLFAQTAMADPLSTATERFGALQSYQVTLRSTDGAGAHEVIRYAYRKPGWVRMDFEQPHRGAVLVYSPDTRRVRLWPFGLGTWPVLNLAPDNALLRNPRGHRVDRSDVGVLLAAIDALRQRGSTSKPRTVELAGTPATYVEVTGPTGGNGDAVRGYHVWLAQDTRFPLRVDSLAEGGRLIESVDMRDVRIDAPFPARLFNP